MSAICGFLNLDGKPASGDVGSEMMNSFKIYKPNLSKILLNNHAFMGCHHQYITSESLYEKLPYKDEDTGLMITADAIIDNRIELFDSFGIPSNQWRYIPDSELILMSYKRWGNNCPVHLIGDYAFVIFNEDKNELFGARDHVGMRTLYFTCRQNAFAFCTLLEPLFSIPGVEKQVNDTYIADFLGIPSVINELDSNHTIYQHIEQLPPAYTIIVNSQGIKKQKYWDPLKVSKLKLKNNAEYEKAFREVFSKAVKCRTRSIGSVGMMLSGGLDSGSVACIAAEQLQEKGERLKTFSALPMEGYKDDLPPYLIADETSYIEAIIEKYSNIDPTYCRMEGKHPLTDIEKFLAIFEQPYKIIENAFWVDHIYERASQNNCKVLLDGQFGNLTISFGSFDVQAFTLFKTGRWLSLIKEIMTYGKYHKISRKKLVIHILKQYLRNMIPPNRREEDIDENLKDSLTLISSSLVSKCNLRERLNKAGYMVPSYKQYTLKEIRELIMEDTLFTHAGAVGTKLSLAYGIANRDPTRDKRVIEFCFSIPGEQFVYNGQERSLIRRAMEGILPDKIRMNTKVRGRQSADWLQRIAPIWQEILEEIEHQMLEGRLQYYINSNELMSLINSYRDILTEKTKKVEIRRILTCLIVGKYIHVLEACCKKGGGMSEFKKTEGMEKTTII